MWRVEHDSMGEIKIPQDALWGAQTQRAVENFPISSLRFSSSFIYGLGLVKYACSKANVALGLMDEKTADAIQKSALLVSEGKYMEHFPIDIFQTGSGTSTNMNSNEVIAHLATKELGSPVHPNDHVNKSQSSNDIIPTSIHVSAALALTGKVIPALKHLHKAILEKAETVKDCVKTGRTHLMDAMPVTMAQELSGWAAQIEEGIKRLENTLPHVLQLAIGGTAVGTGINAPDGFAKEVCLALKEKTGLDFKESPNKFMSLASQDTMVELSGQLKSIAVAYMKIANDLRWMNSGPLTGLAEISLQALQPGSSIMPGKINPVIPEAVCMVAAQVIGNDTAITVGGQAGNFQLNVMLPMIAHNIMESLDLIANTATVMADKAISTFTVNEDKLHEGLSRNPILVTALNTVIGYEKGAAIAKQAYKEGRPIIEVARDMTDLDEETLKKLLDPALLTKGGIPS